MPKLIFNKISGEYEVEYTKLEETKTGQPIIPFQDQMSIRKLYGGLVIYDTSTQFQNKEGQIAIIKTNSVSRRIIVRSGGITTSVSLS